MRKSGILLLLAVGVGGCSQPEAAVIVNLRTDLRLGVEVGAIRSERFEAFPEPGDTSPATRQDVVPPRESKEAIRVAEWPGLTDGTHYVRVQLLSPGGHVLLARVAVVGVHGVTVVTLVMTRDCTDVSCPDPGGDPMRTACLAGQCIDPQCTVETPEYCPEPMCIEHSECAAQTSCTDAECVGGTCLEVEVPQRCEPRQWCHPDDGCSPLPSPDAGAPPPDASMTPSDAGGPASDAGMPMPSDASTGSGDATVGPGGQSVIFITTDVYRPIDVDSVDNANRLCGTAARRARLPGTFGALLSDATIDARDNLASVAYPIVRVDGQVVEAVDLWDATGVDTSIQHPDGTGRTVWGAWTGTQPDGTLSVWNCNDWSTVFTSTRAAVGTDTTSTDWAFVSPGQLCNTSHALYCVQTGP